MLIVKRGSSKKYSSKKAQSTPTPLPWPAQHQILRDPLVRHAKDTQTHVETTKSHETALRRLLRHSGGRRDGLPGGLLGDRCCGCGLAFADMAVGGGDGVVALLCPGRGLGPLGILPCFEQSVSSRVDDDRVYLHLQGPSSLSSQPPGQVHSPPNCLGRFSLGICARSSFW